MLIFKTPGHADIHAFITLGVNAKIGANSIGVFGTGIKYAIAVILRLGGEVTVYIGKKKYKFGLKAKTIRGKEFKLVTMNDRPIGFTSALGAHWQPWMAYRELWSNTKDEDGAVFCHSDIASPVTNSEPERNTTTIVVQCAALEEVHGQRHTVVLTTGPLLTLTDLEVHPGPSNFLFYKGIRVYELKKPSKYTYNLTKDWQLTEDRTLLYPFMVDGTLVRNFVQATHPTFIRDLLDKDKLNDQEYEYSLSYNPAKETTPSTMFMEIAEELRLLKKLNSHVLTVFNNYQDQLPGYVSPFIVTLSPAEHIVVDRARKMVEAIVGTQEVTRYTIQFKSSQEYPVNASSANLTITISHKVIEQGSNAIARSMLTGIAMCKGGRVNEQLAQYILSRSWIPDELQTKIPGSMEELPF